jgi:hypothetical protein
MSQPGRAKRAYNSKGGLVAALIILGIVVLILAIVTVRGLMGPGELAPKPGAESSALAPSVTPSSDGKCEAKADLSTSLSPELPSDLEWDAGNGETWPVSPSYGPTAEQEGLGTCFSRSPLGAAFAATSMLAASLSGHSSHEVTRVYAAESPGKEASLAKPDKEPTPNDGQLTIAGFRINSYVEDRAEVLVVFRAPSWATGYMAVPLQLVWDGDDWKTALKDSGESEPARGISEGEFTPWRSNG